MKVWLVGISDCESNSVICLCSTKELALKRMFQERDKLVKDWRERIASDVGSLSESYRNLYSPMIRALSGSDYENWDNYPHDVPYIQKMEVEDEAK